MSIVQLAAGLLLSWGVLLKTIPLMIEVFKTDVVDQQAASAIRKRLISSQSLSQVSFDLEDCDHVLRVESDHLDVSLIIVEVESMGHRCSVLPD